jgi:hypothetical protein
MSLKKFTTYILGGITLLIIIFIVYVVQVSIIQPNNEIRQEIKRANSTTSVRTQDLNSRELDILTQVAKSIQNRDYNTFSQLVDVDSFVKNTSDEVDNIETNDELRKNQLLEYFNANSKLTNHPNLQFLSTATTLSPTASTSGGIIVITFENNSSVVYLDQVEDTITIESVDLGE